MMTREHPFQVRKVTSGRTGVTKFIVVKNPGGRRVTVHAHFLREGAQADADELNIAALVKPHAEDPRPYDVRLAEAEADYWAEVGR